MTLGGGDTKESYSDCQTSDLTNSTFAIVSVLFDWFPTIVAQLHRRRPILQREFKPAMKLTTHADPNRGLHRPQSAVFYVMNPLKRT